MARIRSLDPTVNMIVAAKILGNEGRLNDPSNDDILIYAAEYCEAEKWPCYADLAAISPRHRNQIIAAYDEGNEEFELGE